jgi:hyperosmotically inducible protein
MRKTQTYLGFALAALLLVPAATFAQKNQGKLSPLEEKVRKELVTIPYMSMFDDLSFRLDNGVVTLFGDVTRPVIKSYAESSVKEVEGVTRVDNKIEVLPLSPNDDDIRLRMFRALARTSSLQKYFVNQVNPPIRIIVKNGQVELRGMVVNQMDSQIASMTANGVSGAFSVKNNLRLEKDSK